MSTYEYNKRYAEKYLGKLESVTVRVPRGRKKTVEAHASSKGYSINAYVNALIRADMGLSEEQWKEAPRDDQNA